MQLIVLPDHFFQLDDVCMVEFLQGLRKGQHWRPKQGEEGPHLDLSQLKAFFPAVELLLHALDGHLTRASVHTTTTRRQGTSALQGEAENHPSTDHFAVGNANGLRHGTIW